MTFARSKPPGWVFSDTLTSAQLNALDTDHANALDKSVANDTLSGTVTMAAGGMLDGNTSGTKIRASLNGSKIAATASGASIEANASGAFIGATAAGAKIQVSGGGAFQTVTDPTGDPNKAAQAYTFATPQSRIVTYPTGQLLTTEIPTGAWTLTYNLGAQNALQITGQATTTPILIPFTPHNGAILQSVSMFVKILGPHTNGLPAHLPYMSIVRVRYTPIALQPWWLWWTLDDLGAPAIALNPPSNFPTPYNVAAYDSTVFWTNTMFATGLANPGNSDPDPTQPVNADQRVVDTSKYLYYLKLIDESGSLAIVGNTYPGFSVTYSGINDLRFAN